MLLKILPLILIAVWLYLQMTATRRIIAALRRDSRELDEPAIQRIVLRFAEKLEAPPFHVRVLQSMDMVNAMALPNGEIYISRGLYDKYRFNQVTRDELAAVLAHEIGHVALGHHKRRIAAWRVETAAIFILGWLLGRLIFGWFGLLAALGLAAARSSMSRKDEFEADAFGAQLMMRAGEDPHASMTLLAKLERWSDGASSNQGFFRWLSSHPPIPERINWIERVIAAGVPSDADAPEQWRRGAEA